MSSKAKTLRSDLGRVKGLGSAREGTAHWWAMRLTSLALIPLTVWFVMSVIGLVSADQIDMRIWLKEPLNAVMLFLFIGFSMHHSAHGLQEVVEDYVHAPWAKTSILIANKLAHVAAAAASAYAILLLSVKV